jgi:hypothetical protein
MNLYIETENGATKNHPAFEDNLIQAFGAVPAQWEEFTRVDCPELGVYELANNNYVKVNGVWTDVWTVREMTTEEKAAKQQETVTAFNNRPQAENWSTWTLDEATNTMQPPIPRPEPDETKIAAGIMTFWCGADANWKDTSVRPKGEYKFDFIAWAWVAV